MTCIIILLSGKRFSGKDTVAAALESLKGDEKRIMCFAAAKETKRLYCEKYNLDFERFLTDRAFKESHRLALTEFYHKEEKETAFEEIVAKRIADCSKYLDIAIVTDWRFERQFGDIKRLLPHCPCLRVRIQASDDVRKERGWKPVAEIDGDATETSLDNASFDVGLQNDTNDLNSLKACLEKQLLPLLEALMANQK